MFEHDKVYVIESDDKIVGVIGYHTDKYETKNVWLGWFYVHSDYQKRGFGMHLFKFIKDKLKKKGSLQNGEFTFTNRMGYLNRDLSKYPKILKR